MRLTPSLVAERSRGALHALQYPAFRRVWLASVLSGSASWVERLAVAWLVLNETGSVFLAALSFAARSAPNIVLGPFGGAIADRFERAHVLRTIALGKAVLQAAIGVAVIAGVTAAWPVLLLVAAIGAMRVGEIPASQALITDIVGPGRAANAIGLNSLGVRAVGMLGAFGGGALIVRVGAGPVFLVTATALVVASAVYSTVDVPRARASGSPASLWREAAAGLGVILRIRVVRTLLLLAVGVEVFAFSYDSLLAPVADRVLHVDAAGLGALTMFVGIGAIAGTATVSVVGDRRGRGRLLLAVTATFGAFLVAFGASERFVLSLLLVMGAGAMASMFDALQWVLLQASVPDEMRGRVLGGWMTAIGFGWLGPITVGAIAQAAGTQWALAATGTVVMLLAVAAAAASPRLRRL